MTTKWGLVRCRWVAVELVLNVVACALLPAFPGPTRELSSGEQPLQDMWFVAFLTISASVLPGLAMVLSVFNPWTAPAGRDGGEALTA